RLPGLPHLGLAAACLTKFARHRLFQIAAREGFWRTANVAEPFGGHQHKHVGSSAADILTFTAVRLRFQARFALSNVSDFPAIASAFERHLNPPHVMGLALHRIFARMLLARQTARVRSGSRCVLGGLSVDLLRLLRHLHSAHVVALPAQKSTCVERAEPRRSAGVRRARAATVQWHPSRRKPTWVACLGLTAQSVSAERPRDASAHSSL